MNNLFLIIFSLCFILSSCSSNDLADNASLVYQCPMKCEGDKIFQKSGSCIVCKMDLKPINIDEKSKILSNTISETSIFNLTSKWKTEENETIELLELKGKAMVVVMIYTTCKTACPRLVADMRNIEAKITKEQLKDLQFVLVSIDPETDTPKRLKAFAVENFMDEAHWTFLQGTKSGVREFANVLAVKYKQISPLDFSHSNIISVFDAQGELVHQQEGLGVDNDETIAKIKEVGSP